MVLQQMQGVLAAWHKLQVDGGGKRHAQAQQGRGIGYRGPGRQLVGFLVDEQVQGGHAVQVV